MRLRHLLKTTALTALLLFAGKVGWGQVLLGENFDYTVGTTITSAGWTDQGAPPTLTNLITVTSGNLSFLNYYSSNVGNQLSLVSSGQDIFKGFASQNTGSVYTSFLVNISAANTAGDYFFALKSVPSGSDFTLVGRLFVKRDASNNLAFGISKTSTSAATISYTGFTYALNTTYLLVVKYTMVAGATNDNVQLFIDPVVGAAEPGSSTLTYIDNASTDASAMAGVSLRQGSASNAATLTVDGLRIATTWADAVKINTAAPAAIFTPANAATGADPYANITIGFDAPIRNTDGSPIADPTSLITLKLTNSGGADVPFTATINAGKNQITIDPTSVLGFTTAYYVAVNPVEDGAGTEIPLQSATFTTRAISSTATVTSTTYTVTAGAPGTIKLIPANVTVATFESKLTSVSGSTFATFVDAACTTPTVGTDIALNGYTLKVTSEDASTTSKYTLVVTPALTADILDNNVDNNIVITYPADATWLAAGGTVVKDGSTVLTVTTDYTLAAGVLTLIPTGTNSLKTPGSRTITVTKTGYADATVTQVINAGAALFANCSMTYLPTPLSLGTTSTVTLTAKDKYNNPISGYTFKYDVTITNADATIAEVYTVDGSAAAAGSFSVTATTNALGVATFPIVMPALVDGGDGISIQTKLNDGTSLGSAISYVGAPALTADATLNDVDHNIVITFTDLAAWRTAITAVKDGATTLVLNTDYTIAAGEITLIPLATNSLKVKGSRTITVIATGYPNSTVTQVINSGAPTATNSTMSPDPVTLALSTSSPVTLTAKDKFDNLVPGYVFMYDVAITNTNAATLESYTIEGVSTTSSASNVALTATDASGVVIFNIIVPGTVDGGDGISVQVQLNDGSTNLGSAIAYVAPLVPAISAIATLTEANLNGATVTLNALNETFKDAVFDKANFTVNNFPGLTIEANPTGTTTSVTVVLSYTGADFDADVTNLSITVLGAELTLNGPLTSNFLTVTAINETPVVTTNLIGTLTNGILTATLGGNVSATGGQAVTQKGICWSTSLNPTITGSKTTEGPGIGAITGSMTNLLPRTLYHVRAYATNSDLTAYGDDVSFTTLDPTLTLNALGATTYYSGFDVPLTWASVGVTNVKIELYDGISAYSTLVASTASDGSETVTLPAATVAGALYKIKITDLDYPTLTSESAAFTIKHVVSIHDIQYTADASGNSPLKDQVVTTSGIVTGIKMGTTTPLAIYIQDGSGPWNGYYVYGLPASPVVALGDKVIVTGTNVEYSTSVITEMSPTTNVVIVSNSNPLPSPVTVTALAAATEQYESVLVKVTNATCNSGSAGTYVVTDATGPLTAWNNLYPAMTLNLTNVYAITGFMSPFGAIWEILPRDASDLMNSSATVTSTVYTVATGAISNIPFSATYAQFISNLTLSSGSTHELYLADGTTPTTTMVTGNKLSVTSQDGSTTNTWTITMNVISTAKDITAFGISSYVGTISGLNISVEVGNSYDLTNLIATFTLSAGASATIGGVAQISGTTTNNFTTPKTYRITAEDNSTKDYIVTVTKAAAATTDLFFSEYVEGSGNNKAFEIYNPTATAIDLNGYTVKASNNGAGFGWWAGAGAIPAGPDVRYVLTFPVGTMINPGDVYIVYNAQATAGNLITTQGDLALTYYASTSTDPAVVAAENGAHPGANVVSFNGNDALGLYKGTTLIDVFGSATLTLPITTDTPTFNVAGIAAAGKDHTCVRKARVQAGNPDWASSAGTDAANSEWIVPNNGATPPVWIDLFTYLGTHTMDPITTGPTIIVSATTLADFGSIPWNTVSTEKSFTVRGTSLTNNIVITAPVGFEISKVSGIGFVQSSPITLTQTAGAVAETQIYVKFRPNVNAAQAYSGNITLTSVGVTLDKTVAVSGTSNTTGIDDNWNSNLSVYPNPFTGEIRFEGAKNVKRVLVASITGQILKNIVIGQVNSIDTQDLQQGMYIVTFVNDKGEKSIHKMIKQ